MGLPGPYTGKRAKPNSDVELVFDQALVNCLGPK